MLLPDFLIIGCCPPAFAIETGLESDGYHVVEAVVLAEQLAVAPPFDPVQLHDQGPLPLTVVADPELHRPVVGAVVKVLLFADPHAPFIALVVKVADTVQLAVIALVV
jgi:hypothetical protein